MGPPDTRRTPGGGTGGSHKTGRLGSIKARVPDRSDVELRCADGVACAEVTARLAAADRSVLEGYRACADELRRTAARFAELHGRGNDRTVAA